MNEIQFDKVDEPYGNFSNFAEYEIEIDGELWSTAEHYFKASKFEDYDLRDKIKTIEDPIQASKFGNIRKNILRSDWDEIKEDIMYKALFAKFTQHIDLKIELLNTDENYILYTNIDRFWGMGKIGKGKNKMGRLLMKVREDIYNISSDPECVLPPWMAFNKLPPRDLFWRMGKGAIYLKAWKGFLDDLEDVQEYIDYFPAKDNWKDAYK